MRKVILFMHTTLDGFVAGLNGEMDWINADDEMFAFAGKQTDQADTAIYGRVTFEMMNGYWPTAGEQPNASKHDIEHSNWYNQVQKIVLSKTLDESAFTNTKVIRENISDNINELKKQEGKNILIFGSATASHSLFNEGLIDDFWLFVNPVVIGQGIPLFKGITETKKMNLVESKTYSCGVIGLHYTKI
jgi:dihydrofolate reductase